MLFRWILTDQLADFRIATHRRRPAANPLGGDKMQALPEGEIAAGLLVLFILSVSMMLQGSFAALAEPPLAMAGRPYLNFLNNGTWLCTNFVLNIVFIHFYSMGIVGAACGALLSTLCVNALRLGQIYRQYAIWPFDLKQGKPAFCRSDCLTGRREGLRARLLSPQLPWWSHLEHLCAYME